MRCHNHFDEVPLDEAALEDFVAGIGPADLAVMISAKSCTSLEARRRVLKRNALAP
jgi:hypothetical protein